MVSGPCSNCGREHGPEQTCHGQKGRRRPLNLIGRTLGGKYEVVSAIASGGNGAILEARDLVFRRTVAIKIPTSPRSSHSVTFRRFAREARAVAAVSHPNVAAIYDAGALTDGTPFLVMERLVGETLASRMSRGRLLTGEAITMMTQLLAGLGAAHARRILHRDLKPANVFLTSLGGYPKLAKILDFGACKFLDDAAGEEESTELTQPGFVLGTPAYMAPEQVRALPTIDHRADVFASAAILYEAVTGRRAFPGTNMEEVLRQVIAARPQPPSELVPGLSKEFDRVIARGLARNPATRYPSAAAFSVALQMLRTSPARATEHLAPREKLARLRMQFREVAEQHRAGAPSPSPANGVDDPDPDTKTS